jgi:hypothetical protein
MGNPLTTANAAHAHTLRRQPLRVAATTIAAAFLAIGVLGFVPGITTNYEQLSFAGHHSGALLLGLFNVSVLHNLVHLGFGVAGLALARTVTGARRFLLVGGVVYALLWVYGLVITFDSAMNFVPVNTADNWLHLALAVAMIALGAALRRRVTTLPPS